MNVSETERSLGKPMVLLPNCQNHCLTKSQPKTAVGMGALRTLAKTLYVHQVILIILAMVGEMAQSRLLQPDIGHISLNLTVVDIEPTAATIAWNISSTWNVTYLELSHRTFSAMGTSKSRTVIELDGTTSALRINGLLERTKYEVSLTAFIAGMSNSSEIVIFLTRSNAELVKRASAMLLPVDLLIICMILLAWGVSISIFICKWSNLRVLPAREHRYKHSPKNLENVKVVKRANDSVIYKSYSRQMSFTMIEREKRFERMHTLASMPAVTIEEEVTKM
ncbi:uncharacterized protein LOC106155120 [Lingula anatina]|uniref:Uncharacterized protein LOC106155120 n=1 Tax=Lingula anatina TaxID=7574 RepID=A0A1S3HJT1_LINAN|nr:uncharacterized protein LOC106155120 [Lingula anatina]|eukprot:XP_013385249.1 uncharacterized protein LOC106155120 [Lingula anatina]